MMNVLNISAVSALVLLTVLTTASANLVTGNRNLNANENHSDQQKMEKTTNITDQILVLLDKILEENLMEDTESPAGGSQDDEVDSLIVRYINAKNREGRKMTVNNNFSGDKMGTHQVFYENGKPQGKQAPATNVQIVDPSKQSMSQSNVMGNRVYG